MKISKLLIMVTSLMVIMFSACNGGRETETPSVEDNQPSVLNVMTHDSFAISENLIANFENENNVEIKFVLSGDTGAALNRAILTKESPQADVFFGVDNTFLSRALEENIFEIYNSPMLVNIDNSLRLDPENYALPVDFGDVCINYDKAYFEENQLSIPSSLSDLLLPEYKGLLVVENPATSSPGLAFMLATIAEFGEDGYLDFWTDLKANGVVVVNDWESAYYSNFSASAGKGNQPMVVSYGSSPPAEVIFSETPLDDAPTASIIAPNTCFRQIEFVGILKGTQQRELAEKFVDFLLDVPFQEDLPLQMFVYPANEKAQLPPEFEKFAQIPDQPAKLDLDLVSQNREKWIQDWTLVVLR
ncbi:MAG: thiamine ABC transporter substrate-binding protein [Anaerolineaceae bacterium]|nr:thiamine ABC transporter substrate-binding protein [Anaerolineaceae bacterium]